MDSKFDKLLEKLSLVKEDINSTDLPKRPEITSEEDAKDYLTKYAYNKALGNSHIVTELLDIIFREILEDRMGETAKKDFIKAVDMFAEFVEIHDEDGE
jgi:hypothetical protein